MTDHLLRGLELAVIGGALDFQKEPTEEIRGALMRAIDALRAHRTKSTPPDPAPLRVEPPEGNVGGRDQHWLVGYIQDDAVAATWVSSGTWIFPDGKILTPEKVHANGWRYHSIASPCKPDTRIVDPLKAFTGRTEEIRSAIERVLTKSIFAYRDGTFGSGTLPASVAIVDEIAGVVQVDTRIEPTDEAIRQLMQDVLSDYGYTPSDKRYPAIVRAALAHFSPTITKDQWEEIRKLAITQAPESFPYGVAKVLGRTV